MINRDSYRLGEATVGSRALGESFRLEARVESVEPLGPGVLTAADFELPAPAGAVRIHATGSDRRDL